jgi:enoyl-CoA hydratase/carnithine racemase
MIPQRILLEVTMTGDSLTGERAYNLGMVNILAPKGQVLNAALELAKRIMQNAPLTVKAAKKMVRISTELGRSEALIESKKIFESVYNSDDALEGPRAFREKRKPKWKGR